MAGSVNKAILLGYVGKDPVLRSTKAGDPVASFSLATSESWRDKDSGERKERTNWHNVVCFNKGLCDVIEKYVKKGSRLYVEGAMMTRKYQKDGEDRYITEVVLGPFGAQLQLMDSRKSGAPSEDDYGTTKSRDDDTRAYRGPVDGQNSLDDEIPF